MADNQGNSNASENEQIPEAKASEVASRDEFGEYSEGTGQNPQDQQQNREPIYNTQEQVGNSNV